MNSPTAKLWGITRNILLIEPSFGESSLYSMRTFSHTGGWLLVPPHRTHTLLLWDYNPKTYDFML